ncbi:hypothetical protein QAD02_000734 [Eretmocerus hayati]|uniref:Uncharacterized protein n=1 Tax=Eretmocerus hayati TaxID=131215 RepID=A0ACC2NE44_9HYME|nr:hypothetical protein QAD02_000734 [Eretmocerus hayati]
MSFCGRLSSISPTSPASDSNTSTQTKNASFVTARGPQHGGWTGFEPIMENSGIVGARCLLCGVTRIKRDRKTLSEHHEKCKKDHQDSSSHNKEGSFEEQAISPAGLSENVSSMNINQSPTPRSTPSKASDGSISKKRRSQESGKNEVSSKIKDNAFLKFLIENGLPLKSANTNRFREFFLLMDPSFCVPSENDLKGEILLDTFQEYLEKNLERNIQKIMYVNLFKGHDGNNYMISVLVDSRKDHVFIDFERIDSFDESIFKEFCEKSVEKAVNMYNICVLYIVHNSDATFPPIQSSAKHNIIYVQDFGLLFEWMDNYISSLDPVEKEYEKEMYEAALNEFKETINSTDSISEASRHLLEFSELEEFKSDHEILKLITDFIQPYHLAAIFSIRTFMCYLWC